MADRPAAKRRACRPSIASVAMDGRYAGQIAPRWDATHVDRRFAGRPAMTAILVVHAWRIARMALQLFQRQLEDDAMRVWEIQESYGLDHLKVAERPKPTPAK